MTDRLLDDHTEREAHRAHELAQQGELDAAWDACEPLISKNPNSARLLVLATYIFDRAGKVLLAYQLARRAVQEDARLPEAWINLGKTADMMWRVSESETAYKKALSLLNEGIFEAQRKEKNRILCHVNLAGLYVNVGRFREGEAAANAALSLDPENKKARGNLGLAQLARRDWASGWKNYSCLLGGPSRVLRKVGDEPTWDGASGKTVAVLGEQGLGDEISFASMLPDAVRTCKKVILECDPRLAGLFQRSFPQAKVYGTRTKKRAPWAPEDAQSVEASLMAGELGGFYRTSAESFSGQPYLVPCPERSRMWGALFSEKKKPVIGIAWTGGVQHTGSQFRRVDLAQLAPLFQSVDAHWVSLQYKDAAEEIAQVSMQNPGVEIAQYAYATLTKDYDDTAAMVSQLDAVICMQTAVAHLAGALGTPCWVLVPRNSQWRYGNPDAVDSPWYASMKVRREKNGWGPVIESLASEIKNVDFRRLSRPARTIAR